MICIWERERALVVLIHYSTACSLFLQVCSVCWPRSYPLEEYHMPSLSWTSCQVLCIVLVVPQYLNCCCFFWLLIVFTPWLGRSRIWLPWSWEFKFWDVYSPFCLSIFSGTELHYHLGTSSSIFATQLQESIGSSTAAATTTCLLILGSISWECVIIKCFEWKRMVIVFFHLWILSIPSFML